MAPSLMLRKEPTFVRMGGDKVFARAVQAGATVDRPLANQFYGDRTGGVVDPFGHKWYIATHVEDVPPDEMEKRAKAAGRS